MGLSATPKRRDGRDRLVEAHIGPVEVRLELLPMRPKVLRYCLEQPILKKIPHSNTRNGHVLKVVHRSALRNRLIVHLIGSCYRKGRSVVVFGNSIDHLENLAAMARVEGVKSTDVGFYVGARDADGEGRRRRVTPGELERASKRPVVMASYGMTREGTNCPWWDACILASPRADVRQAVGRILRSREGKRTPVVVDIADVDSEVFLKWTEARDRWYRGSECGAEVVAMEVPGELRD
jgi:superfamily II DNA or RNA helicase